MAATDGQWVLIDQQPAGETLVTLNPPSAGAMSACALCTRRPRAWRWTRRSGRRTATGSCSSRAAGSGSMSRQRECERRRAGGTSPSWSPDGSRIAFLRGGALLTRAPDGSGEQTLPIDATGVRDVAWSPDGAWFALWLGDRLDIVGVDGSEREPFDGRARRLAWAPDACSSSTRASRRLRGPVGGVRDERTRARSGSPGRPRTRSSRRPARRSCSRGPPRACGACVGRERVALRDPHGSVRPGTARLAAVCRGREISCRSVTPLPKLRRWPVRAVRRCPCHR